MSIESALPTVKDRVIGLRRRDYMAPSLHPNLKKEPPAARQPTPDEDILRPPDDSSNEDSPDSDFGDAPPQKKRKMSESEDSITMESIPRQMSSKTSSAWEPLPNAPSDIKATVWTSSQRNTGDMDDDLEERFSSQKSRTKSKNKYSYKSRPSNNKNIHTTESKPENAKKTLSSPAKTHQDARGFMTRDTTALESRLSDGLYNKTEKPKFHAPRDIPIASPKRAQAFRRSTRSSGTYADHTQPSELSPGHVTPTKSSKEQPTFRAPNIIEIASPQGATRSLTSFRQPLVLPETDEIGTGDMQGLLKNLKSKQFLPSKVPASSTTDSSLLSISNGAASSSSLSSPPDSPGLNDEPAPALCPVCKIPVDRAFLEEFNNGKPLRARQQTYFCKAHKIRTAEQEWKDKGYPKIDWSNLDRRLEKLHPLIEDILAEKRPSYYRNAFEDRISKEQMKTLKATLFDSATMEGVLPGYYGSRGARAIIENITSRFASRIRRLSSSDSVISTGGVPSYIQAVLAPEMAVQLVMEDMRVPDEEGARCIIRDSVKIGNLLNEEQDEAIHLIESEDELAM
ncbi:MAG: hypothetical protein Q9195_003130 [Heterodermia aff. obscurata]